MKTRLRLGLLAPPRFMTYIYLPRELGGRAEFPGVNEWLVQECCGMAVKLAA